MLAVWENEEDNWRSISFLSSKRSNGSDIRWRAIPQMCPAVAETTFQNESVRGLGRANLLSLFLNP